ncbi:MAG: branched-chain amino acid ABC transporter permease, partial [Betaproteobacteria bacterium]
MIRFGIVVLLGIALPFMVPQYALTVIVAALIFGLFAM